MRVTKCLSVAVPLVLLLMLSGTLYALADVPRVDFTQEPGKVVVEMGGQPVATYIYADKAITRPYFAHVRAPGGIQVTRNHPPIEGKDSTDHATMHPGLWMAFGDISGADYWRNKDKVVTKEFVEKPTGGPGKGTFAVRNVYLAKGEAETINCTEVCRYTIFVRPSGYLFIWNSTFSADQGKFFFGDQEEMGLGVRMASPITEKTGGIILNADGIRGAKQAWGKAANWCDYSGAIDGKHVGITLMCDPANFRPSWFHVRDYGLLLANPFGRKSFTKGEPSKVVVKPGETFRLRYGVLLHTSPTGGHPDLKAAYADFLQLIGE